MNKTTFSLRALTLAAALAVAPFGLAAAGSANIEREMDFARSEAYTLRLSADNLDMMARTPMKHSFEAHATELQRLRNAADRVGERVARLEAMRATASPGQAARIDAMGAALRRVATDADSAIHQFNERNGTASLYSGSYRGAISDIYAGARALTSSASAPVAD